MGYRDYNTVAYCYACRLVGKPLPSPFLILAGEEKYGPEASSFTRVDQ